MRKDEVGWLPAVEVVKLVRAGELDRQAIVKAHLERIRFLNPKINAYVHVDEEAAAGAGALTGVTLAVKDTQPVRGMPWTYGSIRWKDRVADRDAVPVARAREVGAAILGKVNLPELAASIGTVNELFPPTQNPWREGFTPGGSSGGSAAAVAAGLCTAAFGDDMGGSIRIPASACGVVGLRPTPGRVPTEFADPTRLSSRGPLTRTVGDARLLLQVMAAEPAPVTRRRLLRIAVADQGPLGVDDACRAACQRAAGALEAMGHRLKPVPWDPAPVAESYRVVRRATLGAQPGEPNEYGAAVSGLIAEGRQVGAVSFLTALASGLDAARWLSDLLDGDYDALLTPTLGKLPMPIPEVPTFLGSDWDRYTQFVLPVSYAGLPAISVPAGLADGLPVGVQLVGRFRHEWRLLALAEQLEAADGFGFQRPPGFD